MRIETILTPKEISRFTPATNAGCTCVVFDILRATTCIVTAIAHGADTVLPVRTIEEALAHRDEHGAEWLLGGERFGNKIAGFDLGNSPLEYLGLAGGKIVSTTTNGTVALDACRGANRIFVGSLLNLEATATFIQWTRPENLRIVCAGTFEDFALEDGVAAGLLIQHFPDADMDDASIAMKQLIDQPFANWSSLIFESKNGRALQNANRLGDIEWALKLNAFPVVVVCDDAGICRSVSSQR